MTTSPGIAPLSPVPPNGPDKRWYDSLQQTVNAAFNDNRPTSKRPSNPVIGQHLLDVTLGKPIWCLSLNPVVWIDAAGNHV